MLLFWRHGYEATSITDLTNAMAVTPPSLYGAFGDKKRLFLEAARRYVGDPDAMALAIDSAPTAYEAARSMLITAATGYTGEATPPGCLLASATASVSAESTDVQAAVADIRQSIRALLERRIERDVAAGVLPSDADAAALAGLVMTVTQGMSVMARDSMPRASLLAIVDLALKAWPGAPR